MSWKLFVQIVLLIIIAALVSATLKCGLMGYRGGMLGKRFPGAMHKSMQK